MHFFIMMVAFILAPLVAELAPNDQEQSLTSTPISGVSETRNLQVDVIVPPECTAGYVDCALGNLASNSATSCETACAGRCCVGTNACFGFTGKVCMDSSSCISDRACASATIPWVVNSCKGGADACISVASNGSTVKNIINSCVGLDACRSLGSSGGGKVGEVRNSCVGEKSCESTAAMGAIGDITNSCNAFKACRQAGSPMVGPPNISHSLNDCCNTNNECENAGERTLPDACYSTNSPTNNAISSPPSGSSKAPTKSPVFVTLPFVGGCPDDVTAGQYYEPGDRVSNGAMVFECKSWPNSLFCSQEAFNPPRDLFSKSNDWKQAWEVLGHCLGSLAPPTAGCPDVWTPGDMAKYMENNQVSVIKSSSPLIQVIYKCKAWPYSLYCGQLSPLNRNGGGNLGWEMVGECTGTVGPTSSPTFDPLTVIITGCPDEYDLAGVKKYVAGDKVSTAVVGYSSYKNVYVCREFPYSGYCRQSGFAPGEQYDYMAWTLIGPCDGTLLPTSAPTSYTGGASCTYTKMETTTPTSTPVVTPVGTWNAGILYEAGDQVRIGATKFQCKPWPYFLWCRMSAYAPTLSETGLWTEAWALAGTCPPLSI